ncbi:MAG TPA: hypothetical protein VFW07_01200 [Parafilimonas sp.]|nr:hypothetical protein [Parafilimonas sp.]
MNHLSGCSSCALENVGVDEFVSGKAGFMIINDLIRAIYEKIQFPTSSRFGYDKKLWGFWCDGIYSLNDEDLGRFNEADIRKFINDKGYLELKIDYGQENLGHNIYRLILYFGRKSLSRNAKELDLRVCIPDFAEEPDKISIDTENLVVEIFLK